MGKMKEFGAGVLTTAATWLATLTTFEATQQVMGVLGEPEADIATVDTVGRHTLRPFLYEGLGNVLDLLSVTLIAAEIAAHTIRPTPENGFKRTLKIMDLAIGLVAARLMPVLIIETLTNFADSRFEPALDSWPLLLGVAAVNVVAYLRTMSTLFPSTQTNHQEAIVPPDAAHNDQIQWNQSPGSRSSIQHRRSERPVPTAPTINGGETNQPATRIANPGSAKIPLQPSSTNRRGSGRELVRSVRHELIGQNDPPTTKLQDLVAELQEKYSDIWDISRERVSTNVFPDEIGIVIGQAIYPDELLCAIPSGATHAYATIIVVENPEVLAQLVASMKQQVAQRTRYYTANLGMPGLTTSFTPRIVVCDEHNADAQSVPALEQFQIDHLPTIIVTPVECAAMGMDYYRRVQVDSRGYMYFIDHTGQNVRASTVVV